MKISSPSKNIPEPSASKDISSRKSKDKKVKTITPTEEKTKYETVEQVQKKIVSKKVSNNKTKVSNVKNEPAKAEILEASKTEDSQKTESKFNVFKLFCKLCDVIASVSKYNEKTAAVKIFINKGMIIYIYI